MEDKKKITTETLESTLKDGVMNVDQAEEAGAADLNWNLVCTGCASAEVEA